MQKVSLDEAKTRLPDLIEAVYQGDTVLITGDDQQLVQLVPVVVQNARPQFGSAKGLIQMADDFDAPLEDFSEYME
jgi:antitoxin (DNA-binding transcriptional repressor) of toxin-antitoxin stability system